MNSISMSDANRQDSVEVAVLHNYAESIKSAVAANCPQNTPGATFTRFTPRLPGTPWGSSSHRLQPTLRP